MDGGLLERPAETQAGAEVNGISQKIAFLVVGAINTLVGFLAFLAWLAILGDSLYNAAVLLAYSISIVVAFVLHRTFVFKVQGSLLRDFVSFVGVNSFGLGLNLVLMFVAVSVIGVPPVPAQVIVLGLVAIASFYGHRHISFRRKAAL